MIDGYYHFHLYLIVFLTLENERTNESVSMFYLPKKQIKRIGGCSVCGTLVVKNECLRKILNKRSMFSG